MAEVEAEVGQEEQVEEMKLVWEELSRRRRRRLRICLLRLQIFTQILLDLVLQLRRCPMFMTRTENK